MRACLLVLSLLCSAAQDVRGIPYFARKYAVTCTQCHVLPPKLNRFGEEFVAAGYRSPELRARGTWPFAVWLSGRSESLPGSQPNDAYQAYGNRVEIISGDALTPWLSYFVEWRTLSKESRGDGSLRDRSGRFEDLFVVLRHGAAELTAGQFRLVSQVDVSRRLGLSEPLVLASGLPGLGTGSGRQIGLRGFSSSGRSPAVRGSWTVERGAGRRLVTLVAIPVPGEFSIPITDSARVQASNEVEFEPKGIFVESFARAGLWSLGAHVFYDNSDRYLFNVLTTGARGSLHWGASAGVARAGTTGRGRWSIEAEAFPRSFIGFGARLEDQAADGVPRAFLPYANVHFPGTRYTVRFTIEQRLQRARNTTLLELGTVF